MTIQSLLSQNPVVPVVTVPDVATACDLASALFSGGVPVVEVALRSPAAIDAIAAIRRAIPDMVVGGGTIRTPMDLERIVEAGAGFAVTPGVTDELLSAVERWDIPLLPGAMTPSDIMTLSERGFDTVKVFPSHALGGMNYIKAISGPFPDMRFCPSGGIDSDNFIEYLRLSSIVGVSGSWIAPPEAIAEADWDRVERIAHTVRQKLDAR